MTQRILTIRSETKITTGESASLPEVGTGWEQPPIKAKKIKVGISIGDLNGIGAEIVMKTFEDSRMLDFCIPILFASIKTMSFFKKHFGSNINFNSINDFKQCAESKVNGIRTKTLAHEQLVEL